MKIIRLIILLNLFIAIFSCNKKEENNKDVVNNPIDTAAATVIMKQIYFSLPSPMELASLVDEKQNLFDYNELYSLDSLKIHSSDKSQAIIMGVYSADLGFLMIMNQTQNIKSYTQIMMKIANNLDIRKGFNDTLLNKIEKNITNKDSLVKLSAKALFSADAYMKENDKIDISTLILNGGWIESIYQLSQILKKDFEDTNLIKIIIDQRLVIDNILKLDSIYLKDNFCREQLMTLKPYFDNMITESKTEVYDNFADTTLLKTKIIYTFDKNKILNLTNEISKVRKNFISLQ